MSTGLDVDASLTVSYEEREVRIHGDCNRIVVDADSWRSIFDLRRLWKAMPTPAGLVSFADGSLQIRVRSHPILSIRRSRGRTQSRPHPIGAIRSLTGL